MRVDPREIGGAREQAAPCFGPEFIVFFKTPPVDDNEVTMHCVKSAIFTYVQIYVKDLKVK